MFFSLESQKNLKFPIQFNINNVVLNTDLGWKKQIINGKTIIYKGYADFFPMEKILEELIEEKITKFTGNFCAFIFSETYIECKSDLYRGFPIYYKEECISNLFEQKNKIFSNQILQSDYNFNIKLQNVDFNDSTKNLNLNFNETIEYIDDLLNKKISKFLSFNELPVKCFLSGGVDSMLVFSYIKKFTKYSIVSGEIYDFDYFTLKNNYDIKKNWAYRQINHFKEPNLWISGAPGDEFMLRSPDTSNLYCISKQTTILNLLKEEKYKDCLHKFYFTNDESLDFFKKQEDKNNKILIKSPEFAKKIIFEKILNDYQHHHLGNTLTYTPLRDLNITNAILNLPTEVVFDQIMDSSISKSLIEKNDKNLLKFLSTYKNYENYMENLIGLVI